MPSGVFVEQAKQKVVALVDEVERRFETWGAARDPVSFRAVEQDVAALLRKVGDDLSACVLESIAADPAFQAATSAAVRSSKPCRNGGRRHVAVTLLGGSTTTVTVEYLKPDRRGQAGRPRKSGRRGKAGAGIYPLLAALGIWFGVTPALAGEICRQVTDSDSVRCARAGLDRRGIDLGHKQTLRIVNQFSARAVAQRDAWLEELRNGAAAEGPLSGKRVVVASDGGRLRERCPGRRGRKRASGHRGYKAPWREPKLLTIYVINDDGEIEESFKPIYDGTLGDCDAIFEMLLGYLKGLGAHSAKELIFVADGAKWIWERVADLAAKLGLAKDRVREVIDWCHAVQALGKIAEARGRWSKAKREYWLREQKKALHAGDIDGVTAAIDALAVGRKAKAISKHRDYFASNVSRMQYKAFESAKIPIGSGAIESAVRRIVNMRMKSNGMFWLEANAEGMLLLRSYLKGGHFDALVDWSTSRAVPWWPSTITSPLAATSHRRSRPRKRPAPDDVDAAPACA